MIGRAINLDPHCSHNNYCSQFPSIETLFLGALHILHTVCRCIKLGILKKMMEKYLRWTNPRPTERNLMDGGQVDEDVKRLDGLLII